MSIKYAILGFLSWQPLTGYELKKLFADSIIYHWSGNNNQIYRTLVKLYEAQLVTKEVQPQADLPARKIYSITPAGQAALKEWVLSEPVLPEIKHQFLIQLSWADQLTTTELMTLIAGYEEEVAVRLLMLDEQKKRQQVVPNRTAREVYLWYMVSENRISLYESELRWIQQLKQDIENESFKVK